MTEAKRCDWCGKTGLDPYQGWWRVETSDRFPAMMDDVQYDFCQYSCAIAKLEQKMAQQHLDPSYRPEKATA